MFEFGTYLLYYMNFNLSKNNLKMVTKISNLNIKTEKSVNSIQNVQILIFFKTLLPNEHRLF